MVIYKVVTYRRWSLTRSGRYERVLYNLFTNTVIFVLLNSRQAQNLVLDNASKEPCTNLDTIGLYS